MNPENAEGAADGGRMEGKAITMAMIAKAAGVSQGAISSLLNDRDYGIRVSAKTRERVFRVCREMGYIPNDLRAVVRMYPEQGDFALLFSREDDPFAESLAGALLRQISTHHLSLAWYDPVRDYAATPESLPAPVKTGVAARFVTLGAPNAALFTVLAAREAFVVHVGQEPGVAGISGIVPEYARASRMAVDALLALGHRRIAILSGPFGSTDPVVIELNYGVRAAYDALKIPIEAQNVIYGNPTFEHGVFSADLLLDRPQKPTAVFCFSPLAAAGVLHRAQARGLNLPGDLSVLAFGEAGFSPLLHPPLTTVSFSAEETARLALEEIAGRIALQQPAETHRIVLPCTLVERGTVAPPGEG